MKIAYITNCFGTQSHTFIRREVAELRRLGVNIRLYGIARDSVLAPEVEAYVRETQYLYPCSILRVITCNCYYLARSPWHYLKGMAGALASKEFGLKRRLKMLYHFFMSALPAKAMQQQQICHIHAHFMNVSASIAMYASHHSRIPFSITVHSAGTYRTPHILGVNQKLRQALFLIMISHYNIDYFDPIEPCRHKSHVVRCGMKLEEFSFRQPTAMESPFRILGVGRFVQKKGFLYLIRAAALLKDRGLAFKLTLIGDGPLLNELQLEAGRLELEDSIEFTGQQNTEFVLHAMQQSAVVVVPSVTSDTGEKEGLPVVIMEAMASGIPVIASDHSGISEIVRQGITGLLTAEKDAAGIADAITSIHDNDNQTMVKSAYDYVYANFNIQAVAEQRLLLFKRYTRNSSINAKKD